MVLGQMLVVIPGHPRRWVGYQFGCVTLQLAEVIEWIGFTQLASVDETHEQIAHFRAVQRAIEQRILTMQHGTLERTLTDVVIQRRTCIAQECGQPFPVA